jgi:hypothetical protein
MFTRLPAFVFGFHGCDKSTAELVLSGKQALTQSTNTYDWLGHGIYFWEQNPLRALEFAKEMSALKNPQGFPRIQEPAVVGAVIDLGQCLNLLDSQFLQLVAQTHHRFDALCRSNNQPKPVNRPFKNSTDLIFRDLDCKVIEYIHQERSATIEKPPFETVRAVFIEGKPLYPTAGFHEKNHIQICVRNPACIKGVFRVDDSHLTE